MKKEYEGKEGWRKRLFEIIYESDTFGGKFFNIAIICCIVISIIIVLLDSIEELSLRHGKTLDNIELMMTILFSIEYLLRIACINKPLKYISSPMGCIDLVAILPTYLSIFFVGTEYLVVIRAFRILRIFRVLKMWTCIEESRQLVKALYASSIKIGVFILFVLVLVIILGSLMHLIEGGKNGFENIPRSIYWAIVTITTVGYGDIAPKSSLGRLFASFIMLFGYGILAVPTGIVTTELIKSFRSKPNNAGVLCPSCGREGHDEDAQFCKYCGGKL